MNTMYADRYFLPIRNFTGKGFTLVEQIIYSNEYLYEPFDLTEWGIDPVTINKYKVLTPDKPKKCAWAFYLPSKVCPLRYRALAMWFGLWSLALGVKDKQGRVSKAKGRRFNNALVGLEKILGLGQREAKPLCEELALQGLISFQTRPFRNAEFELADCLPYAHWFQEKERIDFTSKSDTIDKPRVISDLPEWLHYDDMTPEQKAIYDAKQEQRRKKMYEWFDFRDSIWNDSTFPDLCKCRREIYEQWHEQVKDDDYSIEAYKKWLQKDPYFNKWFPKQSTEVNNEQQSSEQPTTSGLEILRRRLGAVARRHRTRRLPGKTPPNVRKCYAKLWH